MENQLQTSDINQNKREERGQLLSLSERPCEEDQLKELEKAYSKIIQLLQNKNTQQHILDETPLRAAKAMQYLARGDRNMEDLEEQVQKAIFESEGDQQDQLVIVRKIKVHSVCEHHLLPFSGYASVGYIPNKSILGLSKFARIVDAFSRQINLQERLTKDIANYINDKLQPHGVIVQINCQHGCMKSRGIKDPDSNMQSLVCLGEFKSDVQRRNEFLMLIKE